MTYTVTHYSVGLDHVLHDGVVVDCRKTGHVLRVGRSYLDADGVVWTITRTAQTHAPYVFYGQTAEGRHAVFDRAGVAQSFWGGPRGPRDGLRLLRRAS